MHTTTFSLPASVSPLTVLSALLDTGVERIATGVDGAVVATAFNGAGAIAALRGALVVAAARRSCSVGRFFAERGATTSMALTTLRRGVWVEGLATSPLTRGASE